MNKDLEDLKRGIERQLQGGGYIVFHARSRFSEDFSPIFWNTALHPNPSEFLETALSVGIKLIVFHHREFTAELLAEAFEKFESASLPRERRREVERDLKRMKGFEGFTCSVELSYDFDGRTYLFEVTAPWYDDYLDLLDDLDDSLDLGEDDEPPSMSGYFSQN
jgi:hypothetical protein